MSVYNHQDSPRVYALNSMWPILFQHPLDPPFQHSVMMDPRTSITGIVWWIKATDLAQVISWRRWWPEKNGKNIPWRLPFQNLLVLHVHVFLSGHTFQPPCTRPIQEKGISFHMTERIPQLCPKCLFNLHLKLFLQWARYLAFNLDYILVTCGILITGQLMLSSNFANL